MRIQNHDIKLNVQGQDFDSIKSELSAIFAKMNKKQETCIPIPTENRLIDSLCNTIFEQKKRIEALEGELHGLELANNINRHIRKVEEIVNAK